MARLVLPIWACVLLLVLWTSKVQGLCVGGNSSDTLNICQQGSVLNNRVYIDVQTSISQGEACDCRYSLNKPGEVEVVPIFGGTINCTLKMVFTGVNYKIECLQGETGTHNLDSETVSFGLQGNGSADLCMTLITNTPGALINAHCFPKMSGGTTAAPPTTTQPPPPTTQPPAQTTQPPAPTTQPPVQTTQPPVQTTQPPVQTTQPPVQTTQPPVQTTQPPVQTTQSPAQTTQPPGPTTQPPGPTTQPPVQTTQSDTTQPPAGTTQPQGQTGTTTTQAAGSTTASFLERFPIPEVAGGVAGGLFLIVLLVICITCCCTRRNKRKPMPDEERLRPGTETPPTLKMNTKGSVKEGFAFDNLLYQSKHGGMGGKGDFQPVTPTQSVTTDTDSVDEHATRGLEELYASVNKTMTHSTDIM